jgi:hypothetical protein
MHSLLSLFPTTPFVMETGNQLLVLVALTTSDVIRGVFCTVYDMKVKDKKEEPREGTRQSVQILALFQKEAFF